jgi:hypothetical protein
VGKCQGLPVSSNAGDTGPRIQNNNIEIAAGRVTGAAHNLWGGDLCAAHYFEAVTLLPMLSVLE